MDANFGLWIYSDCICFTISFLGSSFSSYLIFFAIFLIILKHSAAWVWEGHIFLLTFNFFLGLIYYRFLLALRLSISLPSLNENCRNLIYENPWAWVAQTALLMRCSVPLPVLFWPGNSYVRYLRNENLNF